jgi:hypothetical protein
MGIRKKQVPHTPGKGGGFGMTFCLYAGDEGDVGDGRIDGRKGRNVGDGRGGRI